MKKAKMHRDDKDPKETPGHAKFQERYARIKDNNPNHDTSDWLLAAALGALYDIAHALCGIHDICKAEQDKNG